MVTAIENAEREKRLRKSFDNAPEHFSNKTEAGKLKIFQ